MIGLPSYQKVLLGVQTVALFGVILRLAMTRLNRVYPYFFAFLIAEALQSIYPFAVTYGTELYKIIFLVSQTVILCFFALIVLELYSNVLRGLAGIAHIARLYTVAAIGVAILVSLLMLRMEQTATTFTAAFFVFERSIVSSLVFFVLLITAFLVYYPVPVSKNVIVYFTGYVTYFLCRSAGLLAQNAGLANLTFLNTVLLTVWVACVMFWLAFLNRAGETKSLVPGHRWAPQDEARLLQQLRSVNDILLRSAKK
jgi:hypothetical protein